MAYQIDVSPKAEVQLNDLDPTVGSAIERKIIWLAKNASVMVHRRLVGMPDDLSGYVDCAWATGGFFTGSIIQRKLCASIEFSTDPRSIAICEKHSEMKGGRTRNKHRGSSFEDFLKEEGLLENVQAAAFKRALALKVHDLMKQKRMNKSAMAARMRTSRAAVHRLLDPENTSVTLATLNRAARSLGCKIKIELVPA